MLKLSVTTAALLDLEQAHEWLTQDLAGPDAAARYQAITDAIEYLAEKPQTWRDGDEPGTQECIVVGYTIVYRADYTGPGRTGATEVEVLRIFGPGQFRHL
jgi:plasmid stabilization system protein ParE